MHCDKTQMLKIIPSNKINGTQNAFNLQILIWAEAQSSLARLKLYAGFSIFDSVTLLLKFIHFSTKCVDSLTLKRHSSFQNKNNTKDTHSFFPDIWILSCNKKF